MWTWTQANSPVVAQLTVTQRWLYWKMSKTASKQKVLKTSIHNLSTAPRYYILFQLLWAMVQVLVRSYCIHWFIWCYVVAWNCWCAFLEKLQPHYCLSELVSNINITNGQQFVLPYIKKSKLSVLVSTHSVRQLPTISIHLTLPKPPHYWLTHKHTDTKTHTHTDPSRGVDTVGMHGFLEVVTSPWR